MTIKQEKAALIEPKPDRPWVVWRSYNGVRSASGYFDTYSEANKARARLQRAMPRFDFECEYIGGAVYYEGS